MKNMKIISLILAVVMVFGVLAACSGSNNSTNTSNSTNTATNTNTDTPKNTDTSTNNETPTDTGKLEGKLTVWTFFGQVEDMGKKFMEKYPDVEVEVKVFPGDQYQTKLLTALAARQGAPDIFDLERGYIGKFINAPFAEDMSAMGAEELLKDYVPYVQELGRDNKGTIRAISDHSSPGGYVYIRENAKKYLGTDDPDEISAMVDTWDKVIELGKKIVADSNGEVHLIPSAGDLFDIEGYNMDPWTKDGALVIDPRWKDIYETQLRIRNEGVDAKLGFFSGGWGNAMNDGSVILTAMPAWAGFMISNKDDQAVGKFGVARTPSGYYMGGTYRAIFSESPNKELAYEFVKFIASPEWQEYNLGATGNTPGSMKVYEDNMETFTSKYYGDQKILKPYYELMKSIPPHRANEYDEDIFDQFKKAGTAGINNNSPYSEVIEAFKKDVGNAFRDLKVE
jgi:multiple sugar transport system substrate-binding protein